jgi:dienelactone hydrolase
METWKRAEHVIDTAIRQGEAAQRHGIYGWSMARQIALALHKEGLLAVEGTPEPPRPKKRFKWWFTSH